MKTKFLTLGVVAVLLIVAVLSLCTMPVFSPEGGVASIVSADSEASPALAADLALINSEAVLAIEDSIVPASAPAATAVWPVWLALGATLVTLVVSRRRSYTNLVRSVVSNLRRISDNPVGAMGTGGAVTKFI